MHVCGQAQRDKQLDPPPDTRPFRETTSIRVEGERGVLPNACSCLLTIDSVSGGEKRTFGEV